MSIDPDDDTPQPMWTEQTGTLEVKPKRQRKPWLYKSEHDRIVNDLLNQLEEKKLRLIATYLGLGFASGVLMMMAVLYFKP
jgi:hypothetical protein